MSLSFLAGILTTRVVIICLAALALLLLWHYVRHRPALLLVLAVLLGLATAFTLQPGATGDSITPEERNTRLLQQQLVADWHKNYQRTLDTLDHTWKQYHLVLEEFSADEIDLEEAHYRLQLLARQSSATQDTLIAAEPPAGLQEENYDLVLAVLQKTRAYAAAQQNTIQRSVIATDPEHQLSPVHSEQNRSLQEVMILGSPAGLFTANEISALRDNVAVAE